MKIFTAHRLHVGVIDVISMKRERIRYPIHTSLLPIPRTSQLPAFALRLRTRLQLQSQCKENEILEIHPIYTPNRTSMLGDDPQLETDLKAQRVEVFSAFLDNEVGWNGAEERCSTHTLSIGISDLQLQGRDKENAQTRPAASDCQHRRFARLQTRLRRWVAQSAQRFLSSA